MENAWRKSWLDYSPVVAAAPATDRKRIPSSVFIRRCDHNNFTAVTQGDTRLGCNPVSRDSVLFFSRIAVSNQPLETLQAVYLIPISFALMSFGQPCVKNG